MVVLCPVLVPVCQVDAVKQAKKSGGLAALFGKVKAGAKRMALSARSGSSSLNSRTGSMFSGFGRMLGRKGRTTGEDSGKGSASINSRPGTASGNQWQLETQGTFGTDSAAASRRTSADSAAEEMRVEDLQQQQQQQQQAGKGLLKGGLKNKSVAAAVPVAEGRRVSWGDGFETGPVEARRVSWDDGFEVAPSSVTPFGDGGNQGGSFRRRSSDSAAGQQQQRPQLMRQGSSTRRHSSHEAVAAAAVVAGSSQWLPPDMVFPTLVKESRKGWWKSQQYHGVGEEGDYTWQEFFDTLQAIYLPNRSSRYSSSSSNSGNSSRRCTVSDSDPEGWLPVIPEAAAEEVGTGLVSLGTTRAIAEGQEGRVASSGSSFQHGLPEQQQQQQLGLQATAGVAVVRGRSSSVTALAVAEGGRSLVFHASQDGSANVPETPSFGALPPSGGPWSPTRTQNLPIVDDVVSGAPISSSRWPGLLPEHKSAGGAALPIEGLAADAGDIEGVVGGGVQDGGLTAGAAVAMEAAGEDGGAVAAAAVVASAPAKPARVRHITFHVDGDDGFEQSPGQGEASEQQKVVPV